MDVSPHFSPDSCRLATKPGEKSVLAPMSGVTTVIRDEDG